MRRREENQGIFSKKNLVAGFIVIVMVASTIGFLMDGNSSQTTERYNKIKFTREETGWSAVINSKKTLFTFLPAEVERIDVSEEIISKLKPALEIDSTSDFNDKFAESIAQSQLEMDNALSSVLGIYLAVGFTENTTYSKPIIACSTATYTVPVIYFKKSNQTSITLKNNCIIAEAFSEREVFALKDRMLYGIFDIIK